MASPATSSHLPALAEPHEREAIAHELQSTMQELVDLSLIGKQLHWAVVGHAFRPVHEQLDELVASWRDLADVVAERAVALGYVPDGQARAIAPEAGLVQTRSATSVRCGSARSSWVREVMPSLLKTFPRWYSTVLGLRKSAAPASLFVEP